MKRKLVKKMLCITIVSAMLISNTAVLSASDNMGGEPEVSEIAVEETTESGVTEVSAEGDQETLESEESGDQSGEEQSEQHQPAEYTITWCNEDGSVITSATYADGETIPGYSGEIPTKEETDTHTYEFSEWVFHDDGAGNITYTAQFKETIKKITITWIDGNGSQLNQIEVDKNGEQHPYEGETPAKEATETCAYEFTDEWEESVDDAGNITYTAKFKEIANEDAEGSAGASSLANATPAITAGVGFYVEELEGKYKLTFGDGFKDMIKSIEDEAEKSVAEQMDKKAEEKAKDPEALIAEKNLAGSKAAGKAQTAASAYAEAEQILMNQTSEEPEEDSKILNLQDVVAVYLLKQKKAGTAEFVVDESSKAELAKVFSEMNTAAVENGEVVFKPTYVEEYIEKNKKTLTEEDKKFLEEYTSINCMLLCAASTGVQGFITESLGEDISAERAKVVGAAYSLVGKICYYYGGKSSVIGWDSRWGSLEDIAAQGGPVSDFGLDCSGYVTWAFNNGYESTAAASYIGHGTTAQWNNSEEISEEEAQPGDIVFLNAPPADGPNNHVGIVVGKDSEDQLIVAHCNASNNTVTVQGAYEAGFRYVRRPLVYNELSEEQVDEMVAEAQE